MPDRQILEVTFDNEASALLAQNKESDRFSSLEKCLIPAVIDEIKEQPYEEKLKFIKNHESLAEAFLWRVNVGLLGYTLLIENCEKDSQVTYGYSTVKTDGRHIANDFFADYIAGVEQKLNTLTALNIVLPTKRQMRRVTVLQIWENGRYIGVINEIGKARMATIYRITDYGSKLLKEHKSSQQHRA